MKKMILLLLVFGLVIGCGREADIGAEKDSLMETDRQFSKLSIEKGTKTAFDYYMTDSTIMYQNRSHPIKGRDAINETMDNEGRLEWEPFHADIGASADLGYTLGKWTYTYADSTGAEKKTFGYYCSIWKKQPDGSWKFVFDGGVQGPPDEK